MRKTSKYYPRLPWFSKNPSIKRGIQNAGHNNLWKYTLVEKVLIYKYKVHSNQLILFNHIVKRDRKNEYHSNIQQDWRKSVMKRFTDDDDDEVFARSRQTPVARFDSGIQLLRGRENGYYTQCFCQLETSVIDSNTILYYLQHRLSCDRSITVHVVNFINYETHSNGCKSALKRLILQLILIVSICWIMG